MSPTASPVTTYRMQQCFNVFPNIYKVFLILFRSYCYCYYVYDRGCWHMYIDTTPGSVPSKASSSSCLLAEGKTFPYLTGLNWFAILHWFVPFRSLLRQMQLGNSHDLLHMLNSSCKAVSSAVAPHIHWITSCSSTSMHRSLFLGLGTTGTVDRKCPRWQPCNWSMGHGSHASKGILTTELTSPAPSADDCFSACRWYIHWTSDYFLILFELCSVWRLKHNITSAVHMITRSLKEHTGFTEIPGRLEKTHLLGQMMLFLKALMVLPLTDVTMNASNTFYGIVYLIWFHWIYCFYPWKDTFPGKKHLGLIDILQLSESPVIFLPSITPETPLAVTLDYMQISLNPAHWNLLRMENDCGCIGVSSWVFDGPTLWPALWPAFPGSGMSSADNSI